MTVDIMKLYGLDMVQNAVSRLFFDLCLQVRYTSPYNRGKKGGEKMDHNNIVDMGKMDFLRRLYHDKRGGQVIWMRKDQDEVSQRSTCDIEDLAATGTDQAGYYTTINTYRGWHRTADSVYNYGAIYIDLDCHAGDLDQIADSKARTLQLLDAAYGSGDLAVPTMITDTGRGYGIYYVLQRSIVNTANNVRQQDMYRRVQRCIYTRYRDIMAPDPMAAQADPTVLDGARVCRIPGTYNAAAGCYCRLLRADGQYYELSDLVQQCHLWDWVSDDDYARRQADKPARRKHNVINLAEYRLPFLSQRLDQLRMLQDLRGSACTDSCREQLLFVAYSALAQIDHDTAAAELQQLNKRFVQPLPVAEVEHIIRETDHSKGYGHSGYYMLSNAYMIDNLALTESEIQTLGIGSGWRRRAERAEARRKKEEKRNQVIGLLTQADRLTYNQIAAEVGVSRRTVCNIAKEAGIARYNCVRESEAVVEDQDMSASSVAGGAPAESAKIATKSVCAMLSDPVAVSLAVWAGDLIGQSLGRVYERCLAVPVLAYRARRHLQGRIVGYDPTDCTRRYAAQLVDLELLSHWLVLSDVS